MVVAVSAPIRERLMAAGVSPEKVRLIRNGIPGEPALLERNPARQALGMDPAAFTVGWVGRMSAEKGPDVMLGAAARLSQENVSVSFIGDGPELRVMREQIATGGLTRHVRLHGSVPDAGRLLAAFDVIVLSSRTEGTPVVLLEAVAAGVPVVATRVGGIPDIVSTHEVLLVSPDAPEEIVAAVLRLKHDAALRSALAQAAYARVSRELSYEQWITSYEEVYRCVAPASGAAP
jgi:glycosyltransferase involved in cell wall biosynthesis